MTPLSDDHVKHLRAIVDLPDLSGTKYRIEHKLASGGMGSVYLATDTELDRPVALKVLTVADEAGALVERMRREARIVARLEHPSIVPVHDCGLLPDSRIYYAMKYVRGQTLGEVLGTKPPLGEMLQLFQKVCQAIAFAHAKGIIHRDVKPDNIMVGEYGEVLLMDWGIARELNRGPNQGGPRTREDGLCPLSDSISTQRGTVVGTAAFMSPEQATGDHAQVDHLSDIYSLGATFYVILTGRVPGIGQELKLPREIDREIPRPLEAICRKAMAPQPSSRYQAAAEMAADLARWLAREPVSAYRENIWQRSVRVIARHQFIVIIVLMYIIVRAIIFFLSGV